MALVPHSLRSKLQLFALLLIVIPGALLALLAYVDARDALEHAIGHQLRQAARDTLDDLVEEMSDGRKELRGWAQQDVMRDVIIADIDKRVSRFLRSLAESGAPYLDLLCVDRTGRVVAASDPHWLDTAYGTHEAVQRALAGDEFFAGPTPEADHGRATIEIAVPIGDPERPGAVIGALVGHYDWAHALRRVDRIRQSLLVHKINASVLILLGDGSIIGESWRDDIEAADAKLVRTSAATVAAQLRRDDPLGHMRLQQAGVLAGYERASDARLGWLALVTEPLAEALAPVRDMRRRILAALAAVLLGALTLATVLAGRMSHPLRDLTRALRDIARTGETLRPVEVRSRDEIGELAAAFNAMAAALARAQDDLVAAARFAFVGEVAAGIAHEIRTPLGIMRSSAQMLARTLPPDQAESAELVDMIIGEVDRLARVVDGLLELARPRALAIEPTPLEPILAHALAFVEGQAREKGIVVHLEPSASALPARCDPEQIYQVALNLVVNALQILPSGGHITLRTLPARDGRVGFEVSDDGPGIAPELRERIFRPFVSMRPGGTGLGLALVQRVVQVHHGSVTVNSVHGGGTSFRVELPIAGGA